MPPVSGRRRVRKGSDLPKPEADLNDPVQTPTRKRRRTNGNDNATASATAVAKTANPHDPDEAADNRSDVDPETAPYNLADDVIRHLHVASYRAAVVKLYNNSVVDPSAQAFAKIAGRDWTFYVSKLRVTIGRPNNKKPTTENDTEKWDLPQVDIDLGPDQQISRLHAEISFDHQAEKWFILINGRNGSYVDVQRLERGQRMYLHSGNVINILGTQMMFLLPGTPPDIHSSIEAQLLVEDAEDSDAGTQEEQPRQPQSSAARNRGKNATSQNSQSASYASHPTSNTTKLAIETPIKMQEPVQPRSKTSPTYGRSLMLEMTEEIDYSLDGAKDIKPPHSYAAMIGQAILSTPEEKATLARIYEYIKEKYAFFRHAGPGWQNSIRHNLSLSKHFEKVPRRTDEPGKGMKWQLVAEGREDYMRKNMQPTRRARAIGSSTPNSPAINPSAAAQTERLMSIIGQPSSVVPKKRTRSITPPLASYPTATESFTPDRGPQASFLTSGPLPAIRSTDTPPTESNAVTPSFSRTDHGTESTGNSGAADFKNAQVKRSDGFNSPPTLSNTVYDGPPGAHLFTPLPPKSNPHAGLQSTAKVPSFYAKDLFSSPAPFWKFANIGSTPARLPDLSPVKMAKEEEDESPIIKTSPVEEKSNQSFKTEILVKDEKLEIEPSSPPAIVNDECASPTRTLSRPLSRGNFGAPLSQPVPQPVPSQANGNETQQVTTKPSISPAPVALSSNPAQISPEVPTTVYNKPLPPSMSMSTANPLSRSSYSRMDVEEEDDGDIDLTRGFEKIGSYHQTYQTNVASR